MYLLSEIVGVVSEVLIIYIFIQGVFPKRDRQRYAVVLSYILYGVGLLVLSFL